MAPNDPSEILPAVEAAVADRTSDTGCHGGDRTFSRGTIWTLGALVAFASAVVAAWGYRWQDWHFILSSGLLALLFCVHRAARRQNREALKTLDEISAMKRHRRQPRLRNDRTG